MKKLLLACSLAISTCTFAAFTSPTSRASTNVAVMTAASAAMIAANASSSTSDEQKEKSSYKVERRKIIFLSYTLHGNDLVVTFHDYNIGKSYKQKGCPTIINKLNKTYYVSYQNGTYAINCSNFKGK